MIIGSFYAVRFLILSFKKLFLNFFLVNGEILEIYHDCFVERMIAFAENFFQLQLFQKIVIFIF